MTMRRRQWHPTTDPSIQIAELEASIRETGFLIVEFSNPSEEVFSGLRRLDSYRRSRAVTIADIGCSLSGAALDTALSSDIVYMREGSFLDFPKPHVTPSPDLIWATGRAGRPALRRLLLGPNNSKTGLDPHEALDLNLIASIVLAESGLPLPDLHSIPALTAARDLMRTSGSGGMALELATFRLLFANKDPNEGAQAFIEKRKANFNLS